MNKKIKRMDNKGVSEIVGTILILSITVVLFSSIFATVSMMEAPDHRTYIDFETSFARTEDNYTLTVTHKGGRTLERYNTAFNIVLYDGTYRSARYEHDSVNLTFPGDMWGISENVVIDLGDLPDKLGLNNWTELSALGYAELMVMDTGRGQLVWRTEFRLGDPSKNVRILDMGVHYPQDWSNYVDAGNSVRLYARIGPVELLEDVNVTVDISPLMGYEGDNTTVDMIHVSGTRFVYPAWNQPAIQISSRQENGSYLLKLDAMYTGDEENVRSDDSYIVLNVGPASDLLDRPNVNIDARKITFTPVSPLNGASVSIRAAVENSGGSSAVCNVTLYDNYTRDGEEAKSIHTFNNVRIAAGGSSNLRATWDIKDSGEHNISLDVTDIRSPGGENLNPNPGANKYLYVQPTILLVDDDKVEDGDATRMHEDLKAADFKFDRYTVTGTNGPPYDKGKYALNKYDIVIWMTGRETEDTITDVDQVHLTEFLENGGNLWLIGEGIWEDLDPTNDFLELYLKAGKDVGDGAPQSDISGINIPLDGEDVFEMVPGVYSGNYLDPKDSAFSAAEDVDGCIAVSYEDDNIGYRTMFNSFLFNSMEGMPGDPDAQPRTNMVYKVINWLGGVEFKGGNDIAVAEQKFSTATPMYMDWVTIEAVIRNNGQDNLTNVNVALRVNDEILTQNVTNIGNLTRLGGHSRVEFMWQAETVGVHEILVVADPYNEIEETNLDNNDIRYKDVNVNVTVRFSIMVVDDDGSDYSGNENTTAYVTEILDRLGYAYEVYTVESVDDPGPDKETILNYNSIFWVCGHSTDTLQDEDIEAISEYLEETSRTSFFLMGNQVLNDLTTDPPTGAHDFLQNMMGIDSNDIGSMSFPNRIKGRADDPIGHGLNYDVEGHMAADPYKFEVLGADVFLTDENGNNVASRHHAEESMTVFMGVDIFHLDGPIYEDNWYADFTGDVDTSPEAVRQELVYMMTKWFGNVDNRIELRVSSLDISIENQRPMLGRSYLLSATIHNVGFESGGALVRFKDGNALIDSENVYVAGNGVTTAEVTWQPLFAGPERPIRVLIDPLSNLEEIGNETAGNHMGFNNHGMIRLPVHYFWDDMENGTANWHTEATIMNINAEHPLEFMSDSFDKIYTDVVSEWDVDASKYLNVTEDFSYSDPRSYWLQEPALENQTVTEEIPIDVVFAIDTSGSMQWNDEGNWVGHDDPDSRWYQARIATISFIENLTDKDRCAIWTFDGNGNPQKALPDSDALSIAYMTEANKTIYIDHINNIYPSGGTPMFDTIGEAIWNIVGRDDYDEFDDSRFEFIVALTDGIDNRNYYWDRHQPFEGYQTGLLDAPPMVFNVAMTCEPLRTTEQYPRAPEWRYYESPYYDDNLGYGHDDNLEFWYWAAGTSSTSYPDEESKYGYRTEDAEHGDRLEGDQYVGRYMYAETGEEVIDLFEEIRYQIKEMAGREAEEGNVTSMPGDDERVFGGDPDPFTEGRIASEPGLMQTQYPYPNTNQPHAIPGRIHAENYDQVLDSGGNPVLGQNIAYYDTTEDNQGGDYRTEQYVDIQACTDTIGDYNIGWIDAGEWVEYTVDVDVSGTYSLEIRVASDSAGGDLRVLFGGADVTGEINFDATGGWQDYITVTVDDVQLSAGEQIMRIEMISSGFNINWLRFILEEEDPDPDPDPGLPTGENYNKTAVTPAFDLTGYSTARLTFWHKYKIVPGMNGAFLQVGFEHEGEWKWRYVIPTHGSYTGNMNMSAERLDDFGRRMDWAWNGVSGGGSFGWSHVQVNILPYIDNVGGSRENVRVRFNYTQYGSGTGYGWFFDDVKLTVSRAPNANITDNMKDVWRQVTTDDHNGDDTTAWWNGEGTYDPDNPSWFLKGIDNSLVSSPIDLTNAWTANLSAYFKFNINTLAGAPPDGFRVEVTTDGGITWTSINLGVRTASGVSDWTDAEDLDRLNVDLSDFRGNVIRIRFRVFTCNAGTYAHYEDEDAGFGGFYVDNVIVSGRTIQEG